MATVIVIPSFDDYLAKQVEIVRDFGGGAIGTEGKPWAARHLFQREMPAWPATATGEMNGNVEESLTAVVIAMSAPS
jgi:hypothetical protein